MDGTARTLVLIGIAWAWLPAIASAQTLYLKCSAASDPAACLASQEQQRSEERAFRKREYTAMRNRAYCLWTGCDGAVQVNRRDSCTIRRYIVLRSAQADRGDDMNLATCIQAGY